MPSPQCRLLSAASPRSSFTSTSAARTASCRRLQSTVPLAYERFGADEAQKERALVMLHGLYGSKQNFRSLAKSLTSRLSRPVYTVDLRNHGESPHAAPMNYSTMADDVAALLDSQQLRQPVLLGHSMGGKVAMALALAQPSLLSGLVSVDMAPSRGAISSDFNNYMSAMHAIRAQIQSGALTTRKQADAYLQEHVEPALGVRQFLLTNLQSDKEKGFLDWRISLEHITPELEKGSIGDFPYAPEDRERTFDKPTLFIKGDKSKYINKKNESSLYHFFPQAQLKVLDAGHWVHAEAPKSFQDALVDFCQPLP